ncbi:amidohydrolase [Oceanobacillus sp. CAU 1775]
MNLATLKKEAEKINEEVIGWRRHLHQYPEVAFQEVETSQFVYDTLQSFGNLEVTRPTKTSVMARLIGSEEGKTIAVRADIDALPVKEENDFDFISKNEGAMHACGHDGHTAILLGAAKILSKKQDEIKGEIRFLFQHAEEVFPGGALEMVDAGVMEGVDAIIGNHLWSPLEAGKISVSRGPVMAAADTFQIKIKGNAGHAGVPHTSVDAITTAAQVVTNLQQIVARNIDPLDSLVVSITKIHGGTAMNVLPGSVEIAGTVRLYNMALRDTAKTRMEQIVKGITEAHGASYKFIYNDGPAAVINDDTLADTVKDAAIELFGEDAVVSDKPNMTAEDFSGFLTEAPGVYFFTGVRDENKGTDYPHHHSMFDIDEEQLNKAVQMFVYSTWRLLNS